MPRFILIEPAIEGWTGHFYEYAARVLRAAKADGFEPILAVHQSFETTGLHQIRYVPAYRMGQRLVPRQFPFYYTARKLKNKLKARLAQRQTPAPTAVAPVTPQPVIQRQHPLRWLMKQTFGRYKVASFAEDTATLFQTIALEEQDIVFFPSASEYEMQGMLRFFQRHPQYLKAHWHFLFHSNIVTAELHAAFLRLRGLLDSGCLHFYTDTEQLTTQYNQLGVLPFSTLPIPVELGFAKTEKKAASAYCVSYIGDARAEKGYQHLPRVVEKLLGDRAISDKLRFVFQSNFNIEEGEPVAIVARAQLETWPEDKVKLLKQALNPTEYRSLLMQSDVVVFPYDSVAYAARSSGIFTEAMVAGIPVVVPEGSWMAVQLQEAIAGYIPEAGQACPRSIIGVIYRDTDEIAESVGEIVAHYDHYRRTAVAFSRQWAAYHNPRELLACLGRGR